MRIAPRAEEPGVGARMRVAAGELLQLGEHLLLAAGCGQRERARETELLGDAVEERRHGRSADRVEHPPDVVVGMGDVVHPGYSARSSTYAA